MNRILTICCFLFAASSFSVEANENTVKKDTINIDFGKNSKIVILVKNKEDLDKMRAYDLNALLDELSISIDSLADDEQVLVKRDESGTRYLRDTLIHFDIKEDTVYDRVRYKIVDGDTVSTTRTTYYDGDVLAKANAKIRIGNIDLKVDFDDLEGEVEQIERDGVSIIKENYIVDPPKTMHMTNFEWGINNLITDGDLRGTSGEPYAVRPWGSWYASFNSVHSTQISGPLFIEWGGNINWYNFKFDNENIRMNQNDEITTFIEQTDPNVSTKKNKLTASYVNVSVIPMIDFSRGKRTAKSYKLNDGAVSITSYKRQGVRFGVGMYAGFRLGSKYKVKYKLDGEREKDKTKDDFNLNNFRYGVRAQFGYKSADFFATYDLNTLFREDRGPDVNAVTFGIVF